MEQDDKTWCRRSPDRNTMKRRWKVATLVLASGCARIMSNFALSHSDYVHRSRWKEITELANMPMPEPKFIADPTGLAFFIASMSFVALASAYYQSTCCDRRQGMIVLCVSMTGLLVAWRLDVGILGGVYCIETWSVLLGLVASDIFQAACQRKTMPREAEKEQTAKGLEMKWQEGIGSLV